MSTYITESRSKYEVSDRRLDDALKWLREDIGVECRTAAYRLNTSVVTCDDEMFGGQVAYSWHEDVSDFMELFCLPGSYATFRDDEEFAWYMAVLGDDGKVTWEDTWVGNPFEERCDELENAD